MFIGFNNYFCLFVEINIVLHKQTNEEIYILGSHFLELKG